MNRSQTPRPCPGVTVSEPFAPGTGGSAFFRIPAMVTLEDGTLAAACDARWDHTGDGGGLDTILSRSKDGGDTWEYSFPNYLGDNGNTLNVLSTCFIDPALATDGQNLWMLVDLYPAGIALNTARYSPVPGSSGFDQAGNLLLRSQDPIPMGEEGYAQAAAAANYDHYLDLHTLKLRRQDGGVVADYAVDGFFNITGTDGTCANLFCADSPFHPWPTGFLYLTHSADGGRSWSTPQLLNLKRPEEQALLVGPGTGAWHKANGHLLFTAYEHTHGFERCSLLWRDTAGCWHRSANATLDTWSSEGAPVVLEDGTVRVFYRDGFEVLRYTDYRFDGKDYVITAREVETAAPKTARNQLSAIRVGNRIYVSTATGINQQRTGGVIHVFSLDLNNAMTLLHTHSITDGSYGYSCLTATEKELALLYESGPGQISFCRLPSLTP